MTVSGLEKLSTPWSSGRIWWRDCKSRSLRPKSSRINIQNYFRMAISSKSMPQRHPSFTKKLNIYRICSSKRIILPPLTKIPLKRSKLLFRKWRFSWWREGFPGKSWPQSSENLKYYSIQLLLKWPKGNKSVTIANLKNMMRWRAKCKLWRRCKETMQRRSVSCNLKK